MRTASTTRPARGPCRARLAYGRPDKQFLQGGPPPGNHGIFGRSLASSHARLMHTLPLTDRALDCETGDHPISRRGPHLPRISRLPCPLFSKDPCPTGPLLGSFCTSRTRICPCGFIGVTFRVDSIPVLAQQFATTNTRMHWQGLYTNTMVGRCSICLAAEQCRENPTRPSVRCPPPRPEPEATYET